MRAIKIEQGLKKLLKAGHDPKDLEPALVQHLLNRHQLVVENNEILIRLAKVNRPAVRRALKAAQIELADLELHDLVVVFELLIPPVDGKLTGAFFTPRRVCDYMVKSVVNDKNQTVLDPACGCGAFLLAAAEKIYALDQTVKPSQIVATNLYGGDISAASLRRCKTLLALWSLLEGEDTNLQYNLRSGDSLNGNWQTRFANIFTETGGGFDLIIGNPPYVKFQDLPEKTRRELEKNWDTVGGGNYNLYFPFFELGVSLLAATGKLAYICPNNWYTSFAGEELREYLASNSLLTRILDFSHLKVFRVQTYTAIVWVDRAVKTSLEYTRLSKPIEIDRLRLKEPRFAKVPYNSLNHHKWRLLAPTDKKRIKKIEALTPLKELYDIRVGVATCKDDVYFIDGTNRDEAGNYKRIVDDQTYTIEANVTMPLVKVSDFTNQEDANNNTRRIIFPYHALETGAVPIMEEEMRDKYPGAYAYFLAMRQTLAARDKGKKEYPVWYAYGRTQGLNFVGEKLLTPTWSKHPRWFLSPEPKTSFVNGYAVCIDKKTPDWAPSLVVLQKILTSKVFDYYLRATSVAIEGDYWCYQKNFIESFGIPKLSPTDRANLARTKDQVKIEAMLWDRYKLGKSVPRILK